MFGQQGLKLGRKSGSESGEGWLGFIQGQEKKKQRQTKAKARACHRQTDERDTPSWETGE